MEMTRTASRKELLYTRQQLVLVGRAFKLDIFDLVCVNFKDEQFLLEEAREGATFGFTGKMAIHPNQIQPIYQAFTPSPEKIKFATEIVEGFERSVDLGKGAFDLNGIMIDMPLVKWAQRILRLKQ
jgi:citrate lyase subunit beta-like protein